MGAVDFGKILALHNAGWSGAKIADEMRMTEDEYDDALTELLDVIDAKISDLEHEYKKIATVLKG